MQKRENKTRLSFIFRDTNEFAHNRGANSIVLGKQYNGTFDSGFSDTVSCRQLFTAGKDGKIRMWEAAHKANDENKDEQVHGSTGEARIQ